MKILIVGSGGREHALGKKLLEAPTRPGLVFAPGNPGMEELGQCFPVSADDLPGLLDLAKSEGVDLTVVGPEVPLVKGIVDLFRKEGLKAFGPTRAAARLEGSKAFSKNFMKKYGIPTADFETFQSLDKALSYVRAQGAPIVVKASGLAAGKGAVVCATVSQAENALQKMLGDKAEFGEAGREVVVEECMKGEEASLFAICDGRDYVLLPSSQDHKRVFDGDKGPNTGGMGAYSPAPLVVPELMREVEEKILTPTLRGMEMEGCPYTGVLYIGIMVTSQGPRVVEYNCRFGDPEAQVVLPVLEGDLLEFMEASLRRTLASVPSRPPTKNAAVVVMTAPGYPGSYPKGALIHGLDVPPPAYVIHAGTKREGGNILTNGGRVLGVVGQGNSLREALRIAYHGCSSIQFDGAHFRKDIGKKGLDRMDGLIHGGT